jgi:phage gp36-like protein
MIFLTYSDITQKVPDAILAQITDNLDSVLDQAENQAIAFVRDHLTGRYDLNAELQKTGQDRHPTLVRWLTDIVIYYIYNRIADAQIPDRIWKNYDDTRAELREISQGKRQTTLTKITVQTSDGLSQPVTYFNFRAKPDRDYNPF